MIQTFIIVLVIAFAMYLFYKVKFFRCKRPAEKQWIQTKATMALGTFITAFGGNLLFTTRGTVDTVVGIVFLLLGVINIILGYRAYKLYLPYAAKEAEEHRLQT